MVQSEQDDNASPSEYETLALTHTHVRHALQTIVQSNRATRSFPQHNVRLCGRSYPKRCGRRWRLERTPRPRGHGERECTPSPRPRRCYECRTHGRCGPKIPSRGIPTVARAAKSRPPWVGLRRAQTPSRDGPRASRP